jgi:hypothetical protein
MLFNLRDISGSNLDSEMFQSLEIPFPDKEIKDVIDELPNDKSPGLMISTMNLLKAVGQ